MRISDRTDLAQLRDCDPAPERYQAFFKVLCDGILTVLQGKSAYAGRSESLADADVHLEGIV